MKSILQSMAGKSLLIANISQGLWWMYLSLDMIDHTNYQALYLQMSCTVLRISQQIIIDQWSEQQTILHLISLFYCVLYIETFLFLKYDNPFGTYANCLLFIITYKQYLSISTHQSNKIYETCKLAFPCYIIIRNIILLFTEFNYYLIESLIIYIIVFFSLSFNNEQINCQSKYQKNQNNAQTELQLKKIEENESANQLQQNQSLNKSLSHASIGQTPLKSQSIFLKEMTYESKLIQFSNLGQTQKLSKSQFNKSPELHFHQFYQNLINSFPQGVLILNQSQQVSYQNNKCEKLLECSGAEQIVDKIKQCLNSAKMPEHENEISNLLRTTRFNKQLNQYALFRIVKELEKENLYVDILDILLQPQKYFQFLEQRFDQFGSLDDSKTDQLTFQQQMFIYEWLFESAQNKKVKQKKLKVIIIPTFMTGNQQEYQQKRSIRSIANMQILFRFSIFSSQISSLIQFHLLQFQQN